MTDQELNEAISEGLLTRFGWTPPKSVDPDILAFREWIKIGRDYYERIDIDAGEYDHAFNNSAFFAGIRYARGEKV